MISIDLEPIVLDQAKKYPAVRQPGKKPKQNEAARTVS